MTTHFEDRIRLQPLPAPEEGGSPVGEPTVTEATVAKPTLAAPREIGGRQGPDPTRFGDWELRGRCIDF